MAKLSTCLSILTVGTAVALGSADRADAAEMCCSDLEERVAELEATAVRKGNKKVAVTLSGHVSRAILFWDDGFEDNVYNVGNKNDQTQFTFEGLAEIDRTWSAGYTINIRVMDTLSDAVNQLDDNGELGFEIWKSLMFVESKMLGRFSIGQESRATDTVPEVDLSETALAAFAEVPAIGGGFFLRRANGNLSNVTIGDTIFHLNGDTANVVRWDSPEVKGFSAAVTWGEDDIFDAALRYKAETKAFNFEGAVGYSNLNDTDGEFAEFENEVIVGSMSIVHNPSGLNFTLSTGEANFEDQTIPTAKFLYLKGGWIAKDIVRLGSTAFFAESGKFEDFLAVVDSSDVIGAPGSDMLPPGAANGRGSEADIWGLGVLQNIEAAEMQVFLAYRHYEFELGAARLNGMWIDQPIRDFETVLVGGKIAF